MEIEDVLKERGKRYGQFDYHAKITQGMKETVRQHPNWYKLDADMKEAIEMILHKIGRIVNGDPNYKDSWTDILGYTKLIENRLEEPHDS